jgi:hypothetical protein
LDDARVPIAQENKESGRITTDYIARPTYRAAFGLLGSNTVRYKYRISIRGHSVGSQLRITAFLESSGNKVQSWRDVGSSNKKIIEALQDSLIEEVEKRVANK